MSAPATAMAPDDAATLGDGVAAIRVERPVDLDDLARVVAEADGRGESIYPQGGRTALDYGEAPRSAGLAVDLRGLDRVIDYPAADMTITVEAGMRLVRLRELVAEQGQRLAIEAPEPDRATIGGIYATDASGPRRSGLGRPRDQIIGVRFVDAAGRAIKGGGRVVKNVAGYDFPKLLTGSMGTLGIIAELTLKVRPRPEAAALVVAGYPALAPAMAAARGLATSSTRPVSVDLLDARAAGAIGVAGPSPWTLAVGYEGNAPAVAWQVERARVELDPIGLMVREGVDAEAAWAAMVGWQSTPPGWPAIKANLRPSALEGWIAGVDPGRWEVAAHAAAGIARARWLGDLDLEAVAADVDRLRAAAVVTGGNLIVPRCPAAWKARLKPWGEPESDLALARRVKAALDPRGLLNPGRFVGGI